MTLSIIIFVGALLAFANGANDNFKGVATLLGSGTTSFRKALHFGTLSTALGSITALFLAKGLLAAFSGKGLVPAEIVTDPAFAGATALAAGSTVLLAARFGLPVSTTHALIGALVGAGLLSSPVGIETGNLAQGLLLPLLSSPFLAFLLANTLYPLFRWARKGLGVTQESRPSFQRPIMPRLQGSTDGPQTMQAVGVGSAEGTGITVQYHGQVLGLRASHVLNVAHFASAGAVSFARGLNDTPKIAALLLVGNVISPSIAIVGVGVAIAAGGLIASKRVANTLSNRVTSMNSGQGFTANLVTSLLVIVASRFGLPVSTTHVSCGALFGIGATTGGAHWKTIRGIVLAWIITLPMAAALGAAFVMALRQVI
jgi:PiT family inorganic phosphate transporter